MTTQLEQLTNILLARENSLVTFDRYYRGEQPISFVPPELLGSHQGRLATLIINWPRVIVDTIEQRLDVEGFLVGDSDEANGALWDVWQANDMDEQSQLVHLDTLVHGISFVSVGEHEDGSPRIEAETAHETAVLYAPGTRRVVAALKQWKDDDGTHARLYLADAVEVYESDPNEPLRLVDRIPHGLGVVPVVPFVNRPRAGSRSGESELADVVRLTDAVSKLATDMLVSSEFHAMPRRWATGIEIPTGPNRERLQEEAKRYWDHATNGKTWLAGPGVSFGQFAAADLSNFVGAIGMLTGQIAAIAGLPPHYLGVNTENPASADAIRSAEASLVARAKRKQRTFGGSWETVMRYATAIAEKSAVADLPSLDSVATIWRDPATPTVAQAADAAVKLVQSNIITPDQALEDLGYSPQQIDQERRRREEATATAATAAVRAQVAEADRLMREQGLSQTAAFAAVGLLQAAQQMAADNSAA